MPKQRGFTLVELVAVMLIMAILAVFATGFFNRTTFDAAGFADEVRAQLAYAQKVAVASRRVVTARVTNNTVSLTTCTGFPDCGSTIPVASPQGQAEFARSAPNKVTISLEPTGTDVITFNPLGVPSTGVEFTISGGGSEHRVTIEAGTGYVH